MRYFFKKARFNKQPVIFLCLWLSVCWMASTEDSLASGNSGDEPKMDKPTKKEPHIFVVGNQHVNDTISKGIARKSEAFKPIKEAYALEEAGQHSKAKEKYLYSLEIMHKLNMNESFDLWLPRLGLSRVYEKLGENDKAIEQLNWLIANCQSESTKEDLIARRDNLLKLKPDPVPKA